jgi:hypothetical protein
MIEENVPTLLLVFLAAGGLQYAWLRKRIVSIADPLFYFAGTSAFALALGCFASDDPWLVLRLFVYFACFYAGFSLASGKPRPVPHPMRIDADLRKFRTIVLVCCTAYLALNLLLWSQSGFILLSDDPSLQKSQVYVGGFGFVRRFNWGVGTFVLIASLYLWLMERSRTAAVVVAVAIVTTWTGGAKSALIPMVFAAGLFIAKPFATPTGRNDVVRLRRIIPLLFLVACVPVAIVFTIENETIMDALVAFAIRLFSFGDVMLYWGQETVRSHFSDLGPIDYFVNAFGSVLGALRVIDYSIPMGNQFVQFTLPAGFDFSDALGPNLPFYVSGELYFGPLIAPLHALAIGFIFGFVRRVFLRYRGRSMLMYSLLSFMVVVSIALPTDEGFAIGQIFNFALFFAPIYIAVALTSGPRRSRSAGIEHPINN